MLKIIWFKIYRTKNQFGGEDFTMTFLESLTTSGVGFLIVFIGLAILIALVAVMGKICGKLLSEEKAPACSAPVAPAVAPAAKEIANREELVAVLSAAVAEELGTDVSAIRVLSLKEIG